MNKARINVDFTEMIDENLLPLSEKDYVIDSDGNKIQLKAGMQVYLYMDDFGACGEKDNLIAEAKVEQNSSWLSGGRVKRNCRIDSKGIYNESQK